MKRSQNLPYRCINKHAHQSADLLIQFLLSETFKAYAILKEMLALASNDKQLADKLLKLTGGSNLIRFFSWEENGYLNKLHHYSLLFATHEAGMAQEQKNLDNEINKAWRFGIEAFDDFHHSVQNLPLLLEKILATFIKITKLLLRIASLFTYNENLVYFLLRHRKELTDICGKNSLSLWLKKPFPKGHSEVKKFLVTRYSARGYNHLMPQIEEALQSAFMKPKAIALT